ncbi:hypothetical protein [Kitasatospora sp. NPDC093806]|uniref:hypothetical protein n=1 Tax=Kitasatospora sp. NPDC093806 TaxID=3155075 RepID=UPI003442D505
MKKPGILAAMALALAATLSPVTTAQAMPAPTGAAAGTCVYPFYDGAPSAYYLCGTNVKLLPWPDGRHEWVLVGTDRRVWHNYQYSANGSWAGWAPLGDSAGVLDGVEGAITGGSGYPIVWVVGSDGRDWCNAFTSGGWTNWYPC